MAQFSYCKICICTEFCIKINHNIWSIQNFFSLYSFHPILGNFRTNTFFSRRRRLRAGSSVWQGGRVIYVTNLNADGPGSLQDALNQTGRRYILFKVVV